MVFYAPTGDLMAACSSQPISQTPQYTEPLTDKEDYEFKTLACVFTISVFILDPNGQKLRIHSGYGRYSSASSTIGGSLVDHHLKKMIETYSNRCTIVHSLNKQVFTQSKGLTNLSQLIGTDEKLKTYLTFLEPYSIVYIESKEELAEKVDAIFAEIHAIYQKSEPEPEAKRESSCQLL